MFVSPSLWHHSSKSQMLVLINVAPKLANSTWTLPGHSRERPLRFQKEHKHCLRDTNASTLSPTRRCLLLTASLLPPPAEGRKLSFTAAASSCFTWIPQVYHTHITTHSSLHRVHPWGFLGKGDGQGTSWHTTEDGLGSAQGSIWQKEGSLHSTTTIHCICMVSNGKDKEHFISLSYPLVYIEGQTS